MDASDDSLALLMNRGLALLEGNRLAEARAHFAGITGRFPDNAEAWYLLSGVNGRLGRMEEAGECCRRAIDLRPDYGEAYVNLGNVLLSQGRLDEALAQYQTALRLRPENALAHGSLGNILSALGRDEEAEASYLTAVRLDPNLGDVYCNLANLKKGQREYDHAIRYYREAIRLNPGLVPAHHNLGASFFETGDLDRAQGCFRRCIELNPGSAEAHNELAIVLKEKGDLEGAAAAAATAVGLDPNLAEAYVTLGDLNVRQGRHRESIDFYGKSLALHPDNARVHSSLLMTMHYMPQYTKSDLFAAAREWGARHGPAAPCLAPPANAADPGRRLRVGYVSADFYTHPVGIFIEPVLAHHDRSQYEVFCYCNTERFDEQTARLRAAADHWCNIIGWADEEAARRMRADEIDILVDLSGHTAENRLPVFAHKPAPLQATWLGYVDTTGLDAMDYIIADRVIIPPEDERYYVEKVARLPGCYIIFTPPRHAVEVSPLPALSAGRATFGCFNNPAKVSEPLIDTWARLLRASPGAELYMKYKPFDDEGVCRRYRDMFAARGVEPQRIRLSGRGTREELLRAYREVDVALDTFPYTGGITTLEALWMGVPVISLRGDRFVGRASASILTAAGLEELVVDTPQAYVDAAVAAVSDPQRLASLRAGLRARTERALCDGPGFTRSVEALYRGMWSAWCHDRSEVNEG